MVIDANSLFARGWYATQNKEVVDLDDRPAGGVSASFKILLSLLDQNGDRVGEKVDRLFLGWDGKSKNDKKRVAKPSEFYEEMDRFKELVHLAFGTDQDYRCSAEADDAVATVALRSEADRIYVVSGDKDLQQLQGGKVEYYCLNEQGVMPRRKILEKWNVKRPSQISIALAILGDPGDNIPGIHRWGKARVKKLFDRVTDGMNFNECLESIVAQIPEEHRPIFYESLDLTMLDSGLEGIPDPSPLVLAEPDRVSDKGIPGIFEPFVKVFEQYTGKNVYDDLI